MVASVSGLPLLNIGYATVVQIKKRVPLASKYLEKTKDVFKQYDKNADGTLSFNELTDALVEIGNKITSLPAVSA